MNRSTERRMNSSGSIKLPIKPDPLLQAGDKIRVLIADDHMTVRAGLSSIIGMQSDMEVVAEANSFVEGWGQVIFPTANEMLANEKMRSTFEHTGETKLEIGARLYSHLTRESR